MLKVTKNGVSLSLSLSLGNTFLEKLHGGEGGWVVKPIPPAFLGLKCSSRVPSFLHLDIVEVQLSCEGFKLVSLPKVNYKKLLAKSLKNEISLKFLQ